MVWGGIMANSRTNLIFVDGNLNAQQYCDEVLTPVVVPFMAERRDVIFQQDNARPHSARLTREHLELHHINVLPWPAVSPDLSPIEHVWDEMKRRLRKLPERQQPANANQLAQTLQTIWKEIPQEQLLHLVASMRRRCNTVVDANGGHTVY